jgi:hypothetical protein
MVCDILWGEVSDPTDPVAKEVSELIRRGGDLAIEIFWAVCNTDAETEDWPWDRGRCHYHSHGPDGEGGRCGKHVATNTDPKDDDSA